MSKKRLGRGYGSGKGGHTSSRGQKGQKSRTNLHILFEGVKVKKSLLRRLPMLRGKLKNSPLTNPITITLDKLNIFSDGDEVNKKTVVEKNLVKASKVKNGIKIVTGKIDLKAKKLTVNFPATQKAKEQIEKLGGSVK